MAISILAHRGFWQTHAEKNSLSALRRALELGFGLETDIRDLDGELVISDDPPRSGAVPLRTLFSVYRELQSQAPLALNMKADGLAGLLQALLAEFEIANYFVFDMSVPDMRICPQRRRTFFSRMSDLEPQPILLPGVRGVWLDGFESDWFSLHDIRRLQDSGLAVSVVSPELHGRDPARVWEMLAQVRQSKAPLLCCTDHPLQLQSLLL